jgi:hypothetical protein
MSTIHFHELNPHWLLLPKLDKTINTSSDEEVANSCLKESKMVITRGANDIRVTESKIKLIINNKSISLDILPQPE